MLKNIFGEKGIFSSDPDRDIGPHCFTDKYYEQISNNKNALTLKYGLSVFEQAQRGVTLKERIEINPEHIFRQDRPLFYALLGTAAPENIIKLAEFVIRWRQKALDEAQVCKNIKDTLMVLDYNMYPLKKDLQYLEKYQGDRLFYNKKKQTIETRSDNYQGVSIQHLQADVNKLCLNDSSIDFMVGDFIINCLKGKDYKSFISELRRVIADKGVILLSLFYYSNLKSDDIYRLPPYTYASSKFYLTLFRKSGFNVQLYDCMGGIMRVLLYNNKLKNPLY